MPNLTREQIEKLLSLIRPSFDNAMFLNGLGLGWGIGYDEVANTFTIAETDPADHSR
jgi:hypothetical protein